MPKGVVESSKSKDRKCSDQAKKKWRKDQQWSTKHYTKKNLRTQHNNSH